MPYHNEDTCPEGKYTLDQWCQLDYIMGRRALDIRNAPQNGLSANPKDYPYRNYSQYLDFSPPNGTVQQFGYHRKANPMFYNNRYPSDKVPSYDTGMPNAAGMFPDWYPTDQEMAAVLPANFPFHY